MLNYHAEEYADVAASLKSDPVSGISNEEVAKRLVKYGPNVIKKRRQKSVWQIIVDQFVSPIVWILLVAGVLAFSFGEIPEGVAVVVVIIINGIIGFIMEWQAVRSMDALRKSGDARVKVIRDGKRREIVSADLVPGDLVYMEAGDLVTADARLVEVHSLAIKESALTGESAQVSKHTDKLPQNTVLADRANSVFSGTVITRGNGLAMVVNTADQTELGRISGIAHGAKKEATPLDRRLKELSKKLIWLTLGITILIFIAGVLRGADVFLMVETAIALAVAAIPEGLPVIATITLANGMVRLARQKAIVKSLEAVQTLGETNIIFTDKTGTLTENRMEVDRIVTFDHTFSISELNSERRGCVDLTQPTEMLLTIGTLCNDSQFDAEDDSNSSGDPIEIALLRCTNKVLGDHEAISSRHKRISEIPFDTDLKMMASLNMSDDEYLVCVKGATEVILDKCSSILDDSGKVIPLTNPEQWLKTEDDLAEKGLRVLSFAYSRSDLEPDHEDFIGDLVYVGSAAFIDPARDEVADAMEACREAGIKIIMVTGDHPETAGNIAEQVRMVKDGRSAVKIHGSHLAEYKEAYNDQQDDILNVNIFARINPSQKLDLVELYQKNNFIVGMTGDGVNDAPALKKADIGIAMGQRGTEAAKEAADMVLKDDSFSSIVLAIKQGRIIFMNIKKFVVYLLSCNLSEILAVGAASFMNLPLPLLPLQILFLNLVTDVFPALALGMGKGEKNIMKEPVRRSDEPLISKRSWASIIAYGIAMTLAVLGVEFYALYKLNLPEVIVNNMTFYTLILVQLWNVFNLTESKTSFFKNEVTKNKYIWMALLTTVVIVVIAWLIPPVREALSLTNMKSEYWGIILAFSLIPVVLIQVFKRLFKVIE